MAMVMGVFKTEEEAEHALQTLLRRGWIGPGQRTSEQGLIQLALPVKDERLMDVTEILRESGALQVHIAREAR